MEDNLCPKCGTPLVSTNYGRKFCPNCGLITSELKSELKDNEVDYV